MADKKISELTKAKQEISLLNEKNENLIERNKALEEEFRNSPKRKDILEKSEELEKKILRLTKQLGAQKELIKRYKVDSSSPSDVQAAKNVIRKPDYKLTMLDLKKFI